MSTKSVIVAILAAAALFAVGVSGCKRNRDKSVATATPRRTQARRNELSSVRNVRPAEVLSASAYRPPVRRRQVPPARGPEPRYYQPYNQPYNQYQQYQYQQQPYPPHAPTYQVANTYSTYEEPLPEPIPVSQLASYSGTGTTTVPQYGGDIYQPAATTTQTVATAEEAVDERYRHLPKYAYTPVRNDQAARMNARTVRPQSADLATAQAHLNPLPQPVQPQATYGRVPSLQPMNTVSNSGWNQGAPADAAPRYNYNFNSNDVYNSEVPTLDPRQFEEAPIPELEPVRYQQRQGIANRQQAAPAPRQVPAIPTLVSDNRSANSLRPPSQRPQIDQRLDLPGHEQYQFRQTSARYRAADQDAEVRRALAPLDSASAAVPPVASAAAPQSDWVASTSASMLW